MIEWWIERATSTWAPWRSSASARRTIQFEPLEPWTENIVRSAPWAAAANRSASPNPPDGSTSVPHKPAGVVGGGPEEPRRDRDVGSVEVVDALLVLEDRRRAPPVVAADVAVEHPHDRRGRGPGLQPRAKKTPRCPAPSSPCRTPSSRRSTCTSTASPSARGPTTGSR